MTLSKCHQRGLYLSRNGEWTSNESDAADFYDIHAVIAACQRHHIRDAKVLLRFLGALESKALVPLVASVANLQNSPTSAFFAETLRLSNDGVTPTVLL